MWSGCRMEPTDRIHDCFEMTLVLGTLYKTRSSADETVTCGRSYYGESFASFASTVPRQLSYSKKICISWGTSVV